MTRTEAELRDRAVDHILKASNFANAEFCEARAHAHVAVADAISNLLVAMSTVKAASK